MVNSEEGVGRVSSEIGGTYSQAVRWGKESLGSTFIAAHGGGCQCGLCGRMEVRQKKWKIGQLPQNVK